MKDSASRDTILADPNAHLEKPDILSKPENENRFKNIIGQSEKMQKIFRIIEKVADSDSTIIVHGESGTGKGLAARAMLDPTTTLTASSIGTGAMALPRPPIPPEARPEVKSLCAYGCGRDLLSGCSCGSPERPIQLWYVDLRS